MCHGQTADAIPADFPASAANAARDTLGGATGATCHSCRTVRRTVGPQPAFQLGEPLRVGTHIGQWHLAGTPGPSTRRPSTSAGSALRGAQHHHRPIGGRAANTTPCVGLNLPNVGHATRQRLGVRLMHLCRIKPRSPQWGATMAAQHRHQVLTTPPGQHGRVGDLVTVQVEDRQRSPSVAGSRKAGACQLRVSMVVSSTSWWCWQTGTGFRAVRASRSTRSRAGHVTRRHPESSARADGWYRPRSGAPADRPW